MSKTTWETDLKKLFWVDPYNHSDVYDGLTLTVSSQFELVGEFMKGKVQIPRWVRSEPTLQTVCAQLIMTRAPEAIEASDPMILKRLRKDSVLLTSPTTLESFFENSLRAREAECPDSSLADPHKHYDKLLERRFKILQRTVYINNAIPWGEIYVMNEEVGVVNLDEACYFPAGVGVYAKPVRAVFKMEPFLTMDLRD